jgi:hypothetical protein
MSKKNIFKSSTVQCLLSTFYCMNILALYYWIGKETNEQQSIKNK